MSGTRADARRAKRIREMADGVLSEFVLATLQDRREGYPPDYGQDYIDELKRRAASVPAPPRAAPETTEQGQ